MTFNLRMGQNLINCWSEAIWHKDRTGNQELWLYLIGQRNIILKFCTRNISLPVNIYPKNVVDPSYSCKLCNLPNANEYHDIMVCQHFKFDRHKLLNVHSRANSSNVLSFENIMNDNGNFRNLSRLMKNIRTALKWKIYLFVYK